MKLIITVITGLLLILGGSAVAKNIVNLDFSEEQVKNAIIEIEQTQFEIGKREAKNVIDLNLFIEDDNKMKKRESKNVFDVKLILDYDEELNKRDGKNILDTKLIISDANLIQRDGKNVFNVDLFFDDNDMLIKRDAKNVVTVNLKLDEDLYKRDLVNIGLVVPDDDLFVSKLSDPESLGFVVGDDNYSLKKLDKIGDNFYAELQSDANNCNGKKTVLNLQSLSEILNTFKEKMLDPTIHAKDKFVISKELEQENADITLMKPTHGDLATALVQRSDLSLFSKYLRDIPALYEKCENIKSLSTKQKQILIIAPTNSAITKLSKKPWEFPINVDSASSESEEAKIIEENVLNFVESHLIETAKFNVNSKSNNVEFLTFNSKTLQMKKTGSDFIVKLEDSVDWVTVHNIELLENGAILSIDESLVH